LQRGSSLKENVWLDVNLLNIKCPDKSVEIIDLVQYKNIYVIGAGKASAEMAKQIEIIFGDRIAKGVVVTKYGFDTELRKIDLLESNHPTPDQNGVEASQKIVKLCKSAKENDLIINLLSGGASALLPLPVNGISLDEKIEVTKQLLESGATIDEMNIVRRHFSKLKGVDYLSI